MCHMRRVAYESYRVSIKGPLRLRVPWSQVRDTLFSRIDHQKHLTVH